MTAIRLRKKSTTQNSWRVVIASWSRWWEKRHYELKVRPVGDCKVIFFTRYLELFFYWSNRSRVVSMGEGLTVSLTYDRFFFALESTANRNRILCAITWPVHALGLRHASLWNDLFPCIHMLTLVAVFLGGFRAVAWASNSLRPRPSAYMSHFSEAGNPHEQGHCCAAVGAVVTLLEHTVARQWRQMTVQQWPAWCGINSTFGMPKHSKEYTFPILIFYLCARGWGEKQKVGYQEPRDEFQKINTEVTCTT
jgi:hypothetical protein